MKIILTTILLVIVFFSNAQNDSVVLSLEDCRLIALENNYGIKISEFQYNISTNIKKSAKTNFFGQLNFIGNYQLTNKPFQVLNGNVFLPVVPFWSIDQQNMNLKPDILENPLFNGIVINPATGEPLTDPEGNPLFFFYSYLPSDRIKFGTHHNFVFGPNFNQPIYLGGKIRNIYKIAQAGNKIAEINLDTEKQNLLYSVDEAYWRLVDLQEKLKLIEVSQRLLNQIKYDVNNLFDEGIVTKSDILQVEVKINELELNKTKLLNGIKLSRMALNQLMGMELNKNIFLSEKPDNINIIPPPQNIDEISVDNRNEIKILYQTLNISLAQEKIIKSRFLPNVNLSANYFFMNPNPYKGFNKSFGSDWTIGLSVQIPITHWGDRIYTMNASRELVEIAKLKITEAQNLIKLDINMSWNNYNEAVKNLALLEKAAELADELFKVAQDNFETGRISVAKLLEAETNRQKAQNDLVEAKTKVKLLEIEFLKKSGQLKY